MARRKIRKEIIAIGLTACFSFCVQMIFCQTVQTITDRTDILIGEQIKLKIRAEVPLNNAAVNKWLNIPDSIPHFEIVEAAKPDTISFKDNSQTIEQTITITSFDSGRWAFPALPVEFDGADGQVNKIVNTDSFYVNVSYSPPDSTNQLRDIKPIIKVSIVDYFWYYIIGGVVLLLLIIYLLYRYLKKRKKSAPLKSTSHLSAYDEAMEELKKLSELDLRDAGEIKTYHSRLAEIFKTYIGRKQNKNITNETTSDLLVSIKNNNLQQEDVSKLATALRSTDAVKFAKYLPLSNESEDILQKIRDIISTIEQKTSNTKPIT